MAEKEIEKEASENPEPEVKNTPRRRRLFTRRNIFGVAGLAALSVLIVTIVVFVLYRAGIFDNYIKDQLTAKMSDIGMAFESDTFRVAASPLTVELKNATFRDKITGEKLFFIRDLHLGLTVLDLLSWRLSRDISIDKTDINGAEVWVNFDENGRSNFSNLKFVEDERGSAVNFRYDSVNFSVQDSVVHFGDLSRSISGDAKNVMFFLAPENAVVGDTNRYKFDLNSSDSNFKYQDKVLDKIDIRASGIVDNMGAAINNLTLKTPIGESKLSGTLSDWVSPKYELDIESTVDITQISNIFATSTALRGVGNFKGHVSGAGETYHINGDANSESLRAAGVYLKAVNVEATVEGTNTNYTANGTAVAEMMTFEDFQVDFPKLVGNVRGTGTDFRWVGELQAIAAKSQGITLGGLFLSDAVAEFKDKKFRAEVGNGRAQRFKIGDTEFEDLRARNLRFSTPNGGFDISSPNATAKAFVTKDYRLNRVTGRNVRVKHTAGQTSVDAADLRSQTARAGNANIRDVKARDFKFKTARGTTDLAAADLTAGQIDVNGTRISGVETPLVTLQNTAGGTIIYSDKLRVAKLDAGSAVLGSLNIAGVRLTIRNGTIEGKSGDIDAGNIALKKTKQLSGGGSLDAVKINKPVFVVEPSGRYRATADMSIGGGVVGSVSLGSATARVDINNDRALLDELTAQVMDGNVNGSVAVAFNSRSLSQIDADFTEIDLSKLAALQSGRIIPIEGKTTGNAHLTFQGTDYRSTSGTLNLAITVNAGTADRARVPVSGNIELTADKGLFQVNKAKLFTEKSELTASGRFDLQDDESNLTLALRSSDATEIRRLIQVTGVSPDLEQQLVSMQVEVAGNLQFDGTVTGNLYNPNIDGKASLDSIILRQHLLGSVATELAVTPTGVELKNGKLTEPNGGNADFAVIIPSSGANNISVTAKLNGVNAGNLLAALPIALPSRISDLSGQTSGTVDISGLPNEAQGAIDLSAAKGTIAGQNFDNLKAKAVFRGTRIDLESGEIRVGDGLVSAKGTYDRQTTAFDFDLTGKQVPLPLALAFLPQNDSIPVISGAIDLTAKAVGESDRASTYDIHFDGVARNVTVGDSALGEVTINGKTANQVLTADLAATLDGHQQVINAKLNFADDNLPFSVATNFDRSPLSPYIAFIPQLKGIPITGTGTGKIDFGGNLRSRDEKGVFVYSTSNLSGSAQFSQLALSIQDTPLAAVEPISIRFNTREVVFENAKFAGGGSNMTISGTKALADDAVNNLEINGQVSLNLLNLAKTDIFFAGIAQVAVRLSGPNKTSRLSGTASSENAAIATFIGSDRLTFERVKARVIFTSNQAEIEEATGYLGGGKFEATGGMLLDGLSVQTFRFTVNGDNVTVPLPADFLTTGDARLEISGIRRNPKENIQTIISGRIFARRSLYTKDIELANIVGGRRSTSLSTASGSLNAPRFDLVIEGRNALVVRNNIADLTASVTLSLTGDANDPRLSGRITANSGTLFYRKDRYDIQRAVLEFPPETAIEPVISLQAETEIGGYQIFINLDGPLNDTERLAANVRSSPALPSNDVVSLITTGSLANTAGGIPTLAQTGINTVAEILTDSIINNPARKATDKLFGLNVFEIDPIISGQQLNPSARLTVGRQINNNLRVTYSTNLSQDQNQVLALEYRVSNKLSFVAQYEQRSLSNVTRNRENFSLEIRFRRRF